MESYIKKFSFLCTINRSLLVILIFALLVRLVFMWVYPDQNFPDSRAYITMSNEIFSGSFVSNNIYMPLYPIWIKITGGGASHIVMDILISVLSVGVIFSISFTIFRDITSALLSSFIASIYPHFIFYSVSGLTEVFYTFLLLLSFLGFYKKNYLLAIFILILALLVKPSLDYLNPILIFLFVYIVNKSGIKKTIKYLALYGVMYTLLLSPWWMHQYAKYGEFVKFTLADGIVLYSGNNPLNISGGGVGRSDSTSDMDLTEFNQIENPVHRNEAMKEAALSYIINNPYRFIELAVVKFNRFWRLWPFTEHYQQWYIVLASLCSYGTVLFLAIGFTIRNGKKYYREIIPIFALIVYLTIVHMVTIGSIRYRFPIEPFLIIFAGYFFVDIFKKQKWFSQLAKKMNMDLKEI